MPRQAIQEKQKARAAEGQSAACADQAAVKHHFICYVVNGKDELLELDGTKAGPLVIKSGVKKVKCIEDLFF